MTFGPHDAYALFKRPPSLRVWGNFLRKLKIADCWIWIGARGSDPDFPYGSSKNDQTGKTISAHRLMCIWLYGDLPSSLIVDHLVCENTLCVNPLHLIPHSRKFNNTRPGAKSFGRRNMLKTHCVRGHELAGDNLIACWLKTNQRKCATCDRERPRRIKSN